MDIIVKAAPKDELGEAMCLLERMMIYSYPSGLGGDPTAGGCVAGWRRYQVARRKA